MKTKIEQGISGKTALRLLCLALVLMLVSCVGAACLQTGFGRVEIIPFTVPTGGGKWLSGNLFKPAGASAQEPVPLVITCHGYLNNNEMQDSTAIELSRRGVAVINMDAYFHGQSSSSQLSVIESTLAEGVGLIPMVEYAWANLDYVDKNRIGVMGHSMGGMAVWLTLAYYGGQYNAALEAAAAPGSEGGATVTEQELAAAKALNKVSAGLASGNVRLSTPELCAGLNANLAINYGIYDEGCYDLSRGNGDLSGECAESLAAVNSALPQEQQVTSVEPGRFYGSAADNSLRVVYNPASTHQLQHFSLRSTADNLSFFTAAFELQPTLGENNQVWLWKELFNLIGLVGLALSVVPMAALLLCTPAFAGLRGQAPQALPAPTGKKRRAIFWGGWLASWLISWFSFMPVAKLDTMIFPGTAGMGFASVFPQQSTNFIMLWAVFNGLVGLVWAWMWKRWLADEAEAQSLLAGIKISAKQLAQTLGLALCVFVGFYGFVFAAEYFFNVDFRIWFVAVCDFSADKLLVALQYLPFYFIFFVANALLTNCLNRVEGQKEWLNLLLCGLGNVLGIVALNAVQYAKLFSTGTAWWQADRLYPMLALPLVLQLFAAAYINRSLYKLTGKIWLGAMVNCLLIVMIGVANTATLLPL